MEHFLLHELVLIGCGKRVDSVQPEKNSIPGIQEEFFFLFGRTERPDRTARPNGPTEREHVAYYLM